MNRKLKIFVVGSLDRPNPIHLSQEGIARFPAMPSYFLTLWIILRSTMLVTMSTPYRYGAQNYQPRYNDRVGWTAHQLAKCKSAKGTLS